MSENPFASPDTEEVPEEHLSPEQQAEIIQEEIYYNLPMFYLWNYWPIAFFLIGLTTIQVLGLVPSDKQIFWVCFSMVPAGLILLVITLKYYSIKDKPVIEISNQSIKIKLVGIQMKAVKIRWSKVKRIDLQKRYLRIEHTDPNVFSDSGDIKLRYCYLKDISKDDFIKLLIKHRELR